MPGRPALVQITCPGRIEQRFTYVLQNEVSDGYSNKLTPYGPIAHLTHPAGYKWEGGEVKDMQISLDIFAGVYEEDRHIDTADKVVTAVENLFSMALPQSVTQGIWYPPLVMIRIGAEGRWWFQRRGIVKDVGVKFMAPWDVSTGKPMRAQVEFTFAAHYADKSYKTVKSLSQLPNSPWRFATGGR